MNKREQGMAETRRAIIEAAGAQFAAYGYEGASFARVAEAMGRPKSAIGYHQFASKAALAAAVVETQQERWRAIEAGLDRPHGLERLAAFLLATSLDARSCPIAAGATRLLHERAQVDADLPENFDWHGMIAAELNAAAQQAGRPEVPPYAPELVLGATFGVFETADDVDDAAFAARLASLWSPLFASFGLPDAESAVQRVIDEPHAALVR